ncbi:hypothetical protein CC2G_009861 [Coprinopsis cinerea AmutBmut pab1-1]|nr:hypothetical protein CC2G_009861 [Coprinopsis cinerea AmutBmut pab1-1]
MSGCNRWRGGGRRQSPGLDLLRWESESAVGHWLPNVVPIPRDRITWKPFWWLCVDLTDGNSANGTPIRLWACNYQNPNQHWILEPVV